MNNIQDLQWLNVKEHPLDVQHLNKRMLIAYHSPIFPGSSPEKNPKIHFASGEIQNTNAYGERYDKSYFFFTGIAGHPTMDICRIIEYLFL